MPARAAQAWELRVLAVPSADLRVLAMLAGGLRVRAAASGVRVPAAAEP